jgi:hypothetical protein
MYQLPFRKCSSGAQTSCEYGPEAGGRHTTFFSAVFRSAMLRVFQIVRFIPVVFM